MKTSFKRVPSDPTVTNLSGRHRFIQLSKTICCSARIIEERCDHYASIDSKSNKAYGSYPYDALRIEPEKVWQLVTKLKNTTPSGMMD